MLLLGVEVQDVISVVIGIALFLLTIFRRELSCNRDYYNSDDELFDEGTNDEPSLRHHHQTATAAAVVVDSPPVHDYDHETPTGVARVITRRKSSSSLLSLLSAANTSTCSTTSLLTVVGENNESIHHNIYHDNYDDDPTDELLESVGFFLSGGPFLHMFTAIIYHIVHFLGTCNSNVSTLFFIDESQQHNSAWNAMTEHYTSISAKLDRLMINMQHHRVGGGSCNNNSSSSSRKSSSSRSQSTGNLQQYLLSDDHHTRALFREMVAMKKLDVTLLPSDAQIVVFSYLTPSDVLSFMCTNKAGRNLLDDSDDRMMMTNNRALVEGGGGCAGHDDKNSDTAMLIWKVLFQRDYSWVLSDWDIGKEAFQRTMTNYQTLVQEHKEQQQQKQVQHSEHEARSCHRAGRVFQHLLSIIIDSEQSVTLSFDSIIAASSTIFPIKSMKEFYFIFSETWLNYTIAGCNTTDKCFVGLHGHVFDISNFVEAHPGSTETLLLQAGRDATVFFESMGHSLGARKLALGMCAVVNGQCTRWNVAGGEEMCGSFQLVTSGAASSNQSFSTCGLIQSKCHSLDMKRNIPGFLIPRKRSMPRKHRGFYHIHERLRREEEQQLIQAARWENEILGINGLFGGVHVYYDPFLGWKWWYTDREFSVVFTASTH